MPLDTYFNAGAIENLRQVEAQQVVIVTDADTEARGVVDEVRRHLSTSNVHVFSDVVPEPGDALVRVGVEVLERVRPDLVVAVGGGSVLDAAKAMRLFHEHPDLSLRELTLPFLDARKRVANYPQLADKVKLVALPTTAGTGSEVSPAAVMTVGDAKVTLVDYSLVPDMAIVDPTLTLTMPPSITADTGIDVLDARGGSGGVDLRVSLHGRVLRTGGAVHLRGAAPRYNDGADLEARTAMANAATIAGLAFSNAFVGVNHALAHAVGARFHIPHGRANAIFLLHTMRYNVAVPTKFMPAPGYSAYVAPEKYATLGRIIFGGRSEEERRRRLFDNVDELLDAVGMPRTVEGCGSTRGRLRAGAARPRPSHVCRPQPANQPPHATHSGNRGAPPSGLRPQGAVGIACRGGLLG